MSEVQASEFGPRSGPVNTAFIMGGALGLAILASLAHARLEQVIAAGSDHRVALTVGCHAAFFVGAIIAAIAAALSYGLLREPASAVAEAAG